MASSIAPRPPSPRSPSRSPSVATHLRWKCLILRRPATTPPAGRPPLALTRLRPEPRRPDGRAGLVRAPEIELLLYRHQPGVRNSRHSPTRANPHRTGPGDGPHVKRAV